MKWILIILLVSSCSSFEYVHIYSANTMGTKKCEAFLVTKDLAVFDKPATKESIKQFADYTGYSECSMVSQSKDHQERMCKNPTEYRDFTSTSMAKCHQFLKKNEIKI
jgi:hypothetical protein